LYIKIPEGRTTLRDFEILYQVGKHVYNENGFNPSPAALEELIARRGLKIEGRSHADFQRDARDRLVLQDGKPVPVYRVQIDAQDKATILSFRKEAEEITQSGIKGVVEMNPEERWDETWQIFNEKYNEASNKEAFEQFFSWQNLGMLGGMEVISATPAGPFVITGLTAKFMVVDMPRLQAECIEVKKAVYAAKSREDLDAAAQRITSLMTTGKVLVADALVGATAKGVKTEVTGLNRGVVTPDIVPTGRAPVTPEGWTLGRLPVPETPAPRVPIGEVVKDSFGIGKGSVQGSVAAAGSNPGTKLEDLLKPMESRAQSTISESPSARGVGRRNLESHETAGGHTIEMHVGRSESWLRNRLKTDPTLRNRDFASSFRNKEIANRVQGRFVKTYRAEIEAWLKSGEEIFRKTIEMGEPVGIVVERDVAGHSEATKAFFMLVSDASAHGWHILTSYPVIK
jgi:hypothetical protein